MTDRLTLNVGGGEDEAVTPDVEVTEKAGTQTGETIKSVQVSEADLKPKEGEGDDLILGKFKSQEDLEKAYSELEQRFSKGEHKAGDETDPAQPAKTPEVSPEAKPSLDKYSDEFMEKGELSSESYAELEKAGYDRQTVDNYIAGQQAIAERMVTELTGVVGGSDELLVLMDWADTNLGGAEKEAYNKVINAGDVEQSKLALTGLKAKYVAQMGQEPSVTVKANAVPKTAEVQGYASHAQVRAAMSDPRYETDEAYRVEVYRKLDVTDMTKIK
jgi:plasmid maintenance system antidote protein VapI